MKPAPDLSELISAARKKLRLKQQELAETCGLDRNQISKFERGHRIPNTDQIARLAQALRIPQAELELAAAPLANPGMLHIRRKFWDEKKATVRRDRPSRIRYFNARQRYPRQIARLQERLRKRKDWRSIRVYLRETRFDSDLEYLSHLLLLDAGAVTDRVVPQRVGINHLPVVDPETRLINGHQSHPALGLDNSLLIPQLSLLTKVGVVRLDFAWGDHVDGCNRWRDLELDGPGHDSRWDLEREEAVRMPIVRYTEEQILSGALLDGLGRKKLAK